MIALCTGDPLFTDAGENTLVTFPSGEGTKAKVSRTLLLLQHNAKSPA